jgi:hypothetical protein
MKSATAINSEIKHTQKMKQRVFGPKIKTLEKPAREKPVREWRLLLFLSSEKFFLTANYNSNKYRLILTSMQPQTAQKTLKDSSLISVPRNPFTVRLYQQ